MLSFPVGFNYLKVLLIKKFIFPVATYDSAESWLVWNFPWKFYFQNYHPSVAFCTSPWGREDMDDMDCGFLIIPIRRPHSTLSLEQSPKTWLYFSPLGDVKAVKEKRRRKKRRKKEREIKDERKRVTLRRPSQLFTCIFPWMQALFLSCNQQE